MSVVSRLLSKVEIDPAVSYNGSPCWQWTGGKDGRGYGTFWLGHTRRAHRVSYEIFIGPIPDGLTLDHLCRVRRCVNPVHLRPLTNRENILCGEAPSAVNAARTHCVYGHPLSGDNLRMLKRGERQCIKCQMRRYREWLARKGSVA